MNYICFNRFKQNALCGEVNIRYGTKLDETNNVISYFGNPICYIKAKTPMTISQEMTMVKAWSVGS